jgi:hypothetical protein
MKNRHKFFQGQFCQQLKLPQGAFRGARSPFCELQPSAFDQLLG